MVAWFNSTPHCGSWNQWWMLKFVLMRILCWCWLVTWPSSWLQSFISWHSVTCPRLLLPGNTSNQCSSVSSSSQLWCRSLSWQNDPKVGWKCSPLFRDHLGAKCLILMMTVLECGNCDSQVSQRHFLCWLQFKGYIPCNYWSSRHQLWPKQSRKQQQQQQQCWC